MTNKIQKTGNSLSVSLPKFLTQKLLLKKGSLVSFSLEDNKIIIVPEVKKETLKDMLKSINKDNKPAFIDMGNDLGRELVD